MNAKGLRVFSGVNSAGEPFIQIHRHTPDNTLESISQLTPGEAVQMGVYLIGAAAEAQNDAATFQYIKNAALASHADETRAAATASEAVAGVRAIRNRVS